MHLMYLIVAATAATSVGFLPERPVGPERAEIEVVYTDAIAAFACDGCQSSYTDSMDMGDSYTYPNGDRWSFTVGTPTVQDATCIPVGYICHFSSACMYSRSGTLTFTNGGRGQSYIYYRVDDETDYHRGRPNLTLALDCSVTCRAGWAGTEDCVYRTIEFYDSAGSDNLVVMSWDVEFCCSRCPE